MQYFLKNEKQNQDSTKHMLNSFFSMDPRHYFSPVFALQEFFYGNCLAPTPSPRTNDGPALTKRDLPLTTVH